MNVACVNVNLKNSKFFPGGLINTIDEGALETEFLEAESGEWKLQEDEEQYLTNCQKHDVIKPEISTQTKIEENQNLGRNLPDFGTNKGFGKIENQLDSVVSEIGGSSQNIC